MQRLFTVPKGLEQKINSALQKHFQLSLQDAKPLAEAVKQLSDFFIAKPDDSTPWKEKWAQIAYLVYFLPLNHARVQAVVTEAEKQNFFSGLTSVIDFGAGFGTASLALEKQFQNFTLIEQAQGICSRFEFLPPAQTQWADKIASAPEPKSTLAVFSYSLTELTELPPWAQNLEALMILEPSTQQDGRKLLALRDKLKAKGFHLWAPCTHQGPCPLFTQSKTDWCHDRIHFQAPKWFEDIEKHLPMKNRTLTTSYLLARKTPPPARNKTLARTVGDRLEEKGKDRQMFCRGDQREFLAWMHKAGLRQEIPRGVLIEVPEDSPKVSNEIRVQKEIKIL